MRSFAIPSVDSLAIESFLERCPKSHEPSSALQKDMICITCFIVLDNALYGRECASPNCYTLVTKTNFYYTECWHERHLDYDLDLTNAHDIVCASLACGNFAQSFYGYYHDCIGEGMHLSAYSDDMARSYEDTTWPTMETSIAVIGCTRSSGPKSLPWGRLLRDKARNAASTIGKVVSSAPIPKLCGIYADKVPSTSSLPDFHRGFKRLYRKLYTLRAMTAKPVILALVGMLFLCVYDRV